MTVRTCQQDLEVLDLWVAPMIQRCCCCSLHCCGRAGSDRGCPLHWQRQRLMMGNLKKTQTVTRRKKICSYSCKHTVFICNTQQNANNHTHTRYKEKQNEILKEKQVIHFGDSTFPCGDSEIVTAVAPPSDKRRVSHAPQCVAEVLQKVQRIPLYISRCESYMQKSAGAQQSCSQ